MKQGIEDHDHYGYEMMEVLDAKIIDGTLYIKCLYEDNEEKYEPYICVWPLEQAYQESLDEGVELSKNILLMYLTENCDPKCCALFAVVAKRNGDIKDNQQAIDLFPEKGLTKQLLSEVNKLFTKNKKKKNKKTPSANSNTDPTKKKKPTKKKETTIVAETPKAVEPKTQKDLVPDLVPCSDEWHEAYTTDDCYYRSTDATYYSKNNILHGLACRGCKSVPGHQLRNCVTLVCREYYFKRSNCRQILCAGPGENCFGGICAKSRSPVGTRRGTTTTTTSG